ncbi:uncharacterized protein LOC113211601 [Frankliniella occidentalis]|uniref:Uncharacterized protein LOC113211601 n=1 Tax=Frankliniella occidentalis TaxID=133901 RepID=A0A6J1SY57_FRAOC|nr:uncharacterized protein LOC113211601 [Frankliniella occidentalis]
MLLNALQVLSVLLVLAYAQPPGASRVRASPAPEHGHDGVHRSARSTLPTWREYLRCAADRKCHVRAGSCLSEDFACNEMAARTCRCDCLGYPGAGVDRDAWDDCLEDCKSAAWPCVRECANRDWSCRNLCRLRCRCECIGGQVKNQTAAAATGTGS